ncbi:MAG TPA: hypothetical protein VMB49_00590 [Acidobacteriaceae bacterium]|nr:hypothetical protein [Acidobacteriaceae bacterium]
MDLTAQYCSARRDIEERSWALTSRLAALTDRLIGLTGLDHQAFLDVRGKCHEVKGELSESHEELKNHRRNHGC